MVLVVSRYILTRETAIQQGEQVSSLVHHQAHQPQRLREGLPHQAWAVKIVLPVLHPLKERYIFIIVVFIMICGSIVKQLTEVAV